MVGLEEKRKMAMIFDDENEFTPIYRGYMKFPLEGKTEQDLYSRSVRTGDWVTKSSKILVKQTKKVRGQLRQREFWFSLTMFDTDGHKRGYKAMTFKTSGGFPVLSKAVDQESEAFKKELAEADPDIKIDVFKSYVVVKV